MPRVELTMQTSGGRSLPLNLDIAGLVVLKLEDSDDSTRIYTTAGLTCHVNESYEEVLTKIKAAVIADTQLSMRVVSDATDAVRDLQHESMERVIKGLRLDPEKEDWLPAEDEDEDEDKDE